MTFQFMAGEHITIDDITYHFAEHPAAPGMPYGQEGRQAVVYQLIAGVEYRALKVFKPRYRLPALVYLGEQLAQYVDLPGLAVCRRTALTPQYHADVLRAHPDMIYAVLMPWIEGPTWMQVLVEKRALTPEQCLSLARSLAHVLATMEQRGLAHCDLSGPNVMLPALAGGKGIALVDVEQMFSPEFRRPSLLPGGSPGYAHRIAPEGLWSEDADRFAGAVLLAEMLGWCDARVREAAWGENYFDPREMQRDCERFRLLVGVLRTHWGEGLAHLFERAWQSDTLSECATLGEWLLLLPQEVPQLQPEPRETPLEPRVPEPEPLEALLQEAQDLEGQGKLDAALGLYRQALALALDQPALKAKEDSLKQAIANLEQKQQRDQGAGTDTAQLFAAGLEAYQRQEWRRARELLAEIVRREPSYARDGTTAETLLRDINRQLRLQRWRRALVALGLLALALILWSAALLFHQWQKEARERATATAQVLATEMAVSAAKGTAQAQAASTATAHAKWTATAYAVASSTAATWATQTAIVQAATAAAQATSTAAGQAQATLTAGAQAIATAKAAAATTQPTKTWTPSPYKYSAPQLSAPANNATFTGYVAMDFSWQPVAKQLAADEYYALIITFQHQDGHRYPYLQAWTKDARWQGQLNPFLYDSNVLADRGSAWQHGWYVVVMRNPGTNEKGQITGTELSPRSEERRFTWGLEGVGPGSPGAVPTPTRTPKT